jgi:hypothetical protein
MVSHRRVVDGLILKDKPPLPFEVVAMSTGVGPEHDAQKGQKTPDRHE